MATIIIAKDPFEAKYQFLINKQERTGLKQQLNDPKAVIEFSNNMCDIYKNIEEYNPMRNVKYLSFLMI